MFLLNTLCLRHSIQISNTKKFILPSILNLQKRKQCQNKSNNNNSKEGRQRNNKRKNRNGKNNKNTKKIILDEPLETYVRQALLLPPNARLRFTLNGRRRRSEDNVWGIRDAMTKTNLVFTAWDGSSNGTETFAVENNLIDVSLPYCSNGVSQRNDTNKVGPHS